MESCFLRRSRDSNPHQPVLELRAFRSCVVPGRSRSTVSCPGHSLCEITSLTPLTAALPGRESRNSMTDKASPLSLHGTRRGPKKAQSKTSHSFRVAVRKATRAPTVNTGPALEETRKQAQTFFHLSPWWSQGAQHPPPPHCAMADMCCADTCTERTCHPLNTQQGKSFSSARVAFSLCGRETLARAGFVFTCRIYLEGTDPTRQIY